MDSSTRNPDVGTGKSDKRNSDTGILTYKKMPVNKIFKKLERYPQQRETVMLHVPFFLLRIA
jgi:hypothetical protein